MLGDLQQPQAMDQDGDVTRLLAVIGQGHRTTCDDLFAQVYDELRAIAHRQLRGERDGHTLTTTDLVHEAYLALVGIDRVSWVDRAHFLAVAATAMRRVLINQATARTAQKRGGPHRRRITVDVDALPARTAHEDFLALDDALRRLEARNERYGRVVECRFFAGMSIEDTATVLSISPATVKRDWGVARAWLHRELGA